MITKLKAVPVKYKAKPKLIKTKGETAYTTKKDNEMFLRKSIESLTRKIFTNAREQSGVSRKKFSEILGFSSDDIAERIETPKSDRWFFSLKTKEAYAQYIGITVAAIDAAAEYASRLLHEEIDDLSVIEAIDSSCLLDLAKAMDSAQQRVWDSFYKSKIQEILDRIRDRPVKTI